MSNKELVVWRRSAKIRSFMLMQMLAWCENRQLVRYRDQRWELRSNLIRWLDQK